MEARTPPSESRGLSPALTEKIVVYAISGLISAMLVTPPDDISDLDTGRIWFGPGLVYGLAVAILGRLRDRWSIPNTVIFVIGSVGIWFVTLYLLVSIGDLNGFAYFFPGTLGAFLLAALYVGVAPVRWSGPDVLRTTAWGMLLGSLGLSFLTNTGSGTPMLIFLFVTWQVGVGVALHRWSRPAEAVEV